MDHKPSVTNAHKSRFSVSAIGRRNNLHVGSTQDMIGGELFDVKHGNVNCFLKQGENASLREE
jgi:hypothetical protein